MCGNRPHARRGPAYRMRQTAARNKSLESVDVGKNLAWPQIRRQAIPGWKITIVKVQIAKNADYQADIGSGTPGAIQVTNLYATARNGSASDSVNASISSKVDPGSARDQRSTCVCALYESATTYFRALQSASDAGDTLTSLAMDPAFRNRGPGPRKAGALRLPFNPEQLSSGDQPAFA